MRKIKKYFVLILVCTLLFTQTISVYAENNATAEWYEMIEEEFDVSEIDEPDIMPYTLYLMNVITTLKKLDTNKLGIRADVFCASEVKTVSITFVLQKKSGSSWIDVASKPVTVYNVSRTGKSVTVSGVSSGTYRGKAIVRVTDKYGYTESLTGYSGQLSI